MTENEIATWAPDIWFLRFKGNMERGYLKMFMKKFFVISGQNTGIPFKRQHGVPLIHGILNGSWI